MITSTKTTISTFLILKLAVGKYFCDHLRKGKKNLFVFIFFPLFESVRGEKRRKISRIIGCSISRPSRNTTCFSAVYLHQLVFILVCFFFYSSATENAPTLFFCAGRVSFGQLINFVIFFSHTFAQR